MAHLLARRQHFVEAHFSDKDSARKFAFTMIEAGFFAYGKDIEPTDKEFETDTIKTAKKYVVQIPFSSHEILSKKNTALVLNAARDAGGKCVKGATDKSKSYDMWDIRAADHVTSGIFDDKPEN